MFSYCCMAYKSKISTVISTRTFGERTNGGDLGLISPTLSASSDGLFFMPRLQWKALQFSLESVKMNS